MSAATDDPGGWSALFALQRQADAERQHRLATAEAQRREMREAAARGRMRAAAMAEREAQKRIELARQIERLLAEPLIPGNAPHRECLALFRGEARPKVQRRRRKAMLTQEARNEA